MLRNHSMFRNDDDAATVQLSDANSTLGNLLLDADWDGCLEYLATPEGLHDARAGNDPLGLGGGGDGDGDDEESSFFAALFVRAPIAIVEAIRDAAPPMSRVGLSRHLAYVLCVVPSEEGVERVVVPRFRTRTWSTCEHGGILRLLLRSLIVASYSSSSPVESFSSPLLERRPCPPRRRGIGASSSSSSSGAPSLLLTPLAIAAYNPDVPPFVVRLLCSLEPRAMNAVCDFPRGGGGGGAEVVETIPLFLAAASPLPPPAESSSPEYTGLRERRWEKVVLLTLSREWHEGRGGLLSGAGEDDDVLASPATREPTSAEVRRACEEAIRMDEWELVREYARRFPPSSPPGGGGGGRCRGGGGIAGAARRAGNGERGAPEARGGEEARAGGVASQVHGTGHVRDRCLGGSGFGPDPGFAEEEMSRWDSRTTRDSDAHVVRWTSMVHGFLWFVVYGKTKSRPEADSIAL